ncbi:ATP-dependent DNA helicase RecQ [Endozoicomonas sp. G2_1]|uniref:RecQ family ATP-dependent DNA helicase n=1 Tax=Endozoicomonas sp. G2_1 TaxID=2821091 RepID=UPI001ADB817E|nr:RecQ family ATP-dependent DNA helicase [Endozoicomonas sp. G2_1]MBO9490373.1 ATP-dependent DNA helicase RecQ [Endozoicomonas sp. G2_1]
MHTSTSSNLNSLLKQHFGFDNFREGQQQCVEQLLSGRSSLAIFPTGSGKSLCYQFAALQLPHLTLVISPLLALMKDQLEFLHSKGIAAASLDSSLTPEQNKQVMADVSQGRIKILMVSVERFKNERFRRFIETVPLSMLVVDEAHCISEWGHNFRPDYLKLPYYREQLNIPLVLLLTATATANVKRDMATKFAIADGDIVQTGFYRQNLALSVRGVAEQDKPAALFAELEQQAPGASGIVYVTLQQSAEQVANTLAAKGISAVAYHAGLADDKRQLIQQQFMRGQYQVVVATIAFGMGIDKADIRFVIHYDLPKSIENYSQEIGRAGRDGLPAQCISLANLNSVNTLENFVYGDTPELSGIQLVLDDIAQTSPGQRWEMQLHALSSSANIRQLPLKTLLVQLELAGVIQPLYSYFAEFKLKFIADQSSILARFQGERQEFLTAVFAAIEMKKVWGEVNFEQLFASYDCDRARVVTALEYLAQKQLIELQTRLSTEVFAVDWSRLQQPALAQGLHNYFVDKEQKEIARIEQLISFFQRNTCLNRYLIEYFDDQHAEQSIDQSGQQFACGHCSACHGQSAHLPRAEMLDTPTASDISSLLIGLRQHLTQQSDKQDQMLPPLTNTIYCRFLMGITMPLFTRYKVRSVDGFGALSAHRYADVLRLIDAIKLE